MKSTVDHPQNHSQNRVDRLIDLLRRNPAITMAELAEAVEVSDRSIKQQIEKLKGQGRLRRLGPARGGRWAVVDKPSSESDPASG
jgi:ATP-dependent DNA helicase RecG